MLGEHQSPDQEDIHTHNSARSELVEQFNQEHALALASYSRWLEPFDRSVRAPATAPAIAMREKRKRRCRASFLIVPTCPLSRAGELDRRPGAS
jgi:hypothetical protein